MGMESGQELAYVRGWVRPAALLLAFAAHAAGIFWLMQPAPNERDQMPGPKPEVMMVALQPEPREASPTPAANPAKPPKPSKPAKPVAPVKPIPIKPVAVGSAAGKPEADPQVPAIDGIKSNAGLLAEIRTPTAGAGGKDSTDAFRSWCGAPEPSPAGPEGAPAPAKKPPADPDAEIVVVNCECVIAMVRPYKLTGEQMALYLALLDPQQSGKRFQGLVATYRSKHGQAKTASLLGKLGELSAKLDTCAVETST